MNAEMIANPEAVPASKTPPMREDLKLAGILGLASAFAAAALFPYLLQVMPDLPAKLARLPIPFSLVIVLQSAQAAVLLALIAFCGLRMGHRVGLGAPWLRAWITGAPRTAQPWLLAAACGVVAALVVVGLDPWFAAYLPKPIHPLPDTGAGAHALAGFLASFYGGIVEEIELRLFFVTLLAWGFARLRGKPIRASHLLVAVLLAAIAFGAGHLPAASAIWPLDAVVVARTLLLNGIAGLVFGWFYVRNGLESAMLSHFAADLVLHVFAPLAAG